MTENEFNSKISEGLRKMSPRVHYLKASDKFSTGVSDFLIWRDGAAAAVEAKYVAEYPKPHTQLLRHEFKGPQITFLESIALTKNRAYGLIGVGEERKIYVFPWLQIPPHGNWKTHEFQYMKFKSFDYYKVEELVDWIFSEAT